ncbi:copper homeostasis protein CutC [Consotaella aegiceratis]|uniref:copper homeostasis protein CutC n=1 Tax=Consotaella aegiceratis TaxID=3097961 RepID=UPI002F3FFB63
MSAPVLLEVCVDDPAGLFAARDGGADRVELCSALALGGLTPSVGLMRLAAASGTPTAAMIRPRVGSFVFTPDEVDVMFADIETARSLGLQGVVLGAARPDGALDGAVLARLREAAGPLEACLHRVFDLTPDPFEALDQAVALGFDRILTSGQQTTAVKGLPLLQQLRAHAAGRIAILPGSGITPDNVAQIVDATGVRQVHASCGAVDGEENADLVRFGFAPATPSKRTSAAVVRDMKGRLDRLCE